MKVTKGQLKSLLKECIKELLDEGAFNNALEEVLTESHLTESRLPQQTQAPVSAQQIIQNAQQPAQADFSMGAFQNPQERLRALTRQTAMLAGGNSDPKQRALLENIFADTAQHTLPNDPGELGGLMGQTPISHEEQNADMAQLNVLSQGQGIGRWAQAAFNGKKKA